MATYKHDYTEANNDADDFGVHVRVQHNLNKDSPAVTVWRKQGAGSFLETVIKARQVSNNEVRVYTGAYGEAFAIEVRVND